MQTDQVIDLRALKGAPLSILVCMMLTAGPVGWNQLVLKTGWSKNSVTAGLAVLQSMGLAQPLLRYNGWVLTARVAQLELPGMIEGGNPKIWDSPSTTTTESTISIKQDVVSNPNFEQNREALAALGVYEPVRSQVANLPHVTPEYINCTQAALVARGKGKETGLLIHKIKAGDSMVGTVKSARDRFLAGEFAHLVKR